MKRIALFCDGTWNDPNDANPTNVYWLSKAAEGAEPAQEAHYFNGVGVTENRITGGVWGVGLDDKVCEAYQRLCERYELRDHIYVFGFSRGAYTARSLVGMIRKCGILRQDALDKVPEAMRLYRRRDPNGPDSAEVVQFRAQFCTAYVDDALLASPVLPADVDPRLALRVRYLGVWDTVGALGVPEHVPLSRHFNRRHRFHNCDLSRSVEWARHALAIDETRSAFEHTPFSISSITAINAFYGEERVQQVWFPGDHGSVGGGGPECALSDAALRWMAEGAELAGLTLNHGVGRLAAAVGCDPVNGPLRNSPSSNRLMQLRGLGPRTMEAPKEEREVSDGAKRRARENPTYLGDTSRETQWRRTTLARVLDRLLG